MPVFEAMLVRERINMSQRPVDAGAEAQTQLTVIRSTRLHLQLPGRVRTENVVIRAQNMHTTLRIGAKLLFSFFKSGLFTRRSEPFDWNAMWELLLTNYERKYAPDLWAAVYIDGEAVFKTEKAPLVDVIEQCALLSVDNYDATMQLTEKVMGHLGQDTHIEHVAKVAAVFTDEGTQLRCGVIHRAGGKDSTFSFTAAGGETYSRVIQGFHIAASFLEAIEIRHYMREVQRKLHVGRLTKSSPEMVKYNAGPQRLKDLRRALETFEEHFNVHYRPEKPDIFVPPRESV